MIFDQKFDHAEVRLSEGQMRALKGAQNATEPALMGQTVGEAHMALDELAKQVDELLQRIVPVCQPTLPVDGRAASTQTEPAGPPISPIRAQFMHLRDAARRISDRISSVRYTIEI